ncbi:TIGR01777 family protein [Skermania sp. ID1734]|uniref:TIGR01777 family oxidoreductase n=1 Tax=Skermania sp. ID1734 TaxID=2597516 RepID=UPI0011800C28|nr:TIGR01777 family oxidoreductase [Skermania sp. ID1734]TSE01165.1 TIGR01777 family protein [Skermania sp. ID1734]
MRVVIAGSSGLIGTALVASLRRDGHDVARLVRRRVAGPDEFEWDPENATIDDGALTGADAVVNLCGSAIEHRRWTGAFKQELRDSRINSTDVLATAVGAAGVPVLINASGVHIYGDTNGRVVDEHAPAGTGFLPTLCVDWEAATAPARAAGTRTVLLRSASVLAPHGGAMGKMRLPYLLGLGARMGSGRQYFPWISLADEIGAITFLLTNPEVSGPVNAVGPAPVTQAEFNRALARGVHRPAPWVLPKFALRAAVGELADEVLLTGPRAIPAVLESAGYRFQHNTIGAAVQAALG